MRLPLASVCFCWDEYVIKISSRHVAFLVVSVLAPQWQWKQNYFSYCVYGANRCFFHYMNLAFSLKRQHRTMWNTTLHPYKSINSLSSHWEYITIKLSIIDFHPSPIIQWLSILIGNFVIIIHYKHKKHLIWSSMLV